MVYQKTKMKGKAPEHKADLKNGSKEISNFGMSTVLESLAITLTYIVSVFILLLAVRNSVKWYMEVHWSVSEDIWQTQWNNIVDILGDDPHLYFVYGGVVYTGILYWIIGAFFTLLDVTNKPAMLRKYKVQPGTNEPVDKKKLLNAVIWVVFNQTIVSFAYVNFWNLQMQWRGIAPLRILPTFQKIVVDLLVCALMYEILFYYSHRLLHHRFFYRFIHKKHHEWTSPIAITAIYCHPIEHIVSNLFAVLIGPVIMKSHVITITIWVTIAITYTMTHHSGYHLPFFISPEHHDFHHLKFNWCFGVLGFLDRIHGTDEAFRKAMAYKRHNVLFTLKSARIVHPDKLISY